MMLDSLERRFGRFAISNITLYLIIGQAFVFFAAMFRLLDLRLFPLLGLLVREGEWWRLVTFLFMPPPVNMNSMLSLVFLPFAWWIFYLMGNALEHYWGAFRYNVFLLVGVLLTIGAAFLAPTSWATNAFLAGSVFLAFAWLNPDFELSLFFILPIKVKWLALFTWLYYGYRFVMGDWGTRWLVLASVSNFLLFFGGDILNTIRFRQRTRAMQARRVAEEKRAAEPRHRCHVCGKTDLTNPEMDFRYCSKCAGDQCYCPEHIFNHAHVVEESGEAKE